MVWHCWTCTKSGKSLTGLLRRLNAPKALISQMGELVQEFVPVVSSTDIPVQLPAEYLPLTTHPHNIALAYLKSRGITGADIMLHQIGYCTTGPCANRVIIPSFDVTGKLNFWIGRACTNSWLNYLMPKNVSKDIIGFEQFINFDYPIVLVEGVFDAMAVKRNTIPLFGKTVPKRLQMRLIEEGVKEVYLALDKDALRQTVKVAEKFMHENIDVYVVKLPGKDPSQIGFIEMRKLIRDAEKLTFVSLINLKLSL